MMNIFSSFIVLGWLGIERGAGQSLTCGESGVPTVGQSFEIYCSLVGKATVYYGVLLKKEDSNLMKIPIFDENVNATFSDTAVSSRLSAVVSVTPGVSRTVTVKFSKLECIDNGVYNWEIIIFTDQLISLLKQQGIAAKVTPQFGSADGTNITFSPARNLEEGDTVTFTCQGDAGNIPVGQLSWFYYLNESTTAVDVSNKATTGAPLDSTVAWRTCSKTRLSTLTLILTKEMHWFVVRCTVNQDQPFNTVGQGYKLTQRIDVMYKPTIRSLTRVPDANHYTEGDVLVTLTCTATSNPAPEFYWIYESDYTNRTQIGAGNNLILRNLNLNMTGMYTCEAFNLIKGVNHTTKASIAISVVPRTTTTTTEMSIPTTQVLPRTTTTTTEMSIPTTQVYGPKIISVTRNPNYVVYVEGLETLTLTCVASGNPIPSFMWIFQSGYYVKEQVGYENQLILRPLTIEHTGFYTCLVYNTINGINQSTYSSVLVHVEDAIHIIVQTKKNDAIAIGATFGITVAVLAIILAIVFVVIGRRYRCFKRQESYTQRNVKDAPTAVEFDEYQTAPYYSIPRMYVTLQRTPEANEPYTQLESAGGQF